MGWQKQMGWDKQMQQASQRSVHINGIDLHVTEQGTGPLMLLCHGWPELGFSWRHQIPALAAAGYRCVAPDMRGFGRWPGPQRCCGPTSFAPWSP